MDNWTEKYADTQRAFLLGAVDEIEVGVVLFANNTMAESEEEAHSNQQLLSDALGQNGTWQINWERAKVMKA